MTSRNHSARKRVTVPISIDPDHWHHVQGEARLLSEVSGQTFTPEGIVQVLVEHALVDRVATFWRNR